MLINKSSCILVFHIIQRPKKIRVVYFFKLTVINHMSQEQIRDTAQKITNLSLHPDGCTKNPNFQIQFRPAKRMMHSLTFPFICCEFITVLATKSSIYATNKHVALNKHVTLRCLNMIQCFKFCLSEAILSHLDRNVFIFSKVVSESTF